MLGRIKRPESQAALVEAADGRARTPAWSRSLASALVDLLPDDEPTLATLRAIARDGAYDRTVLHLDEDLLALSTMTGVALPEGRRMAQRIEQNRARWAMGMSNVDQAFQPPGVARPVDAPHRPADARRRAAAAAAAPRSPNARRRRWPRAKPFRNAQPKVGRNDPCPCGSGKKYKKCCGK